MVSALAGLLIAVASAALAAESTPPSKVQSPPDDSTVTLTGCLAKGEPAGSSILTNVHFDSVNTPTASRDQHAIRNRRRRVLDVRSFTHVAAECK